MLKLKSYALAEISVRGIGEMSMQFLGLLKFAAVNGLLSKLFFNPEQLIIFAYAVRSGKRSGLDLSGIGGNGYICNRDIFGFP